MGTVYGLCMEEVYASSSTTCLYYCHSVIYLTAIMSMNFIANEMAKDDAITVPDGCDNTIYEL